MAAGQSLDEAQVLEIAAGVGLDTRRLEQDIRDPAIQEAIARNLQLANALGITGTPSFVIGDRVVPGAVDLRTLQGLVARARQN
jgi:protein-disulfide isomerase